MRYSSELDDLVCGFAVTQHREGGPLDRDDVRQIGRLAAIVAVDETESVGYVMQRVKWRIADAYRRHVAEPVEVTEENGGSTPDVADEVARADHVASLLARLPAGERRLVELVDVAGLRQADVAAWLGMPVGTVASARHRAFARLRCAA